MAHIITGDEFEPEQPEPDKEDNNYEVGNGKPPKATQFKLGNKCGKGRTKGSKNLKTIVNEALGAKMTAKVDGKVKKVSKIELAIHQLSNKGAGGDTNAITRMIDLYDRFGPPEDPTGPSTAENKMDIATLRAFLEMQDIFRDDGEEQADA